MDFPIVIHKDENSVYGITVPDVPGCFSAGDNIKEAVDNAKETILGHLATLVDFGESISDLKTSGVEDLRSNEDYKNAYCWVIINVDLGGIKGHIPKTETGEEYILAPSVYKDDSFVSFDTLKDAQAIADKFKLNVRYVIYRGGEGDGFVHWEAQSAVSIATQLSVWFGTPVSPYHNKQVITKQVIDGKDVLIYIRTPD